MKQTLFAVMALFLAVAAAPARAQSLTLSAPTPTPTSPTTAPDDPAPLVAAFGDSLSSGYSLPDEEGFAPALRRALAEIGVRAEVQNHGVAGDTTDDALNRVDWMLREKPDIVIVEFGANDMFRAYPPAHTRANLDIIIRKVRQTSAVVVLAGMLAPLNSGRDFALAFNGIYPELASRHDVELYPFFLKDVAQIPELNLPDGLHPNAEGIKVIAANIAPIVARAIRQWRASAAK